MNPELVSQVEPLVVSGASYSKVQGGFDGVQATEEPS
jgi:hypothetical protein